MHYSNGRGKIPAARLLTALAAVWLAASGAGAQEEAAAAIKAGWQHEFNAGLNLNRGNSETMLLNGGWLSEYKRAANELRLDLQGAYGESTVTTKGSSNSTEQTTEQTTVQNVKGIVDYKRLFSQREYAYANASALHDRMADIDYRLIVGPGLGRFFMKSERHNLNGEAGVAYIRQRLGTDTENTLNLRLAQRYELLLSTGAKFWESVEYLPVFDDFDNYLVNFEIGVEAPILERLSLRTLFIDKYNSRPAPGKKENDLQLLVGVAIKL